MRRYAASFLLIVTLIEVSGACWSDSDCAPGDCCIRQWTYTVGTCYNRHLLPWMCTAPVGCHSSAQCGAHECCRRTFSTRSQYLGECVSLAQHNETCLLDNPGSGILETCPCDLDLECRAASASDSSTPSSSSTGSCQSLLIQDCVSHSDCGTGKCCTFNMCTTPSHGRCPT